MTGIERIQSVFAAAGFTEQVTAAPAIPGGASGQLIPRDPLLMTHAVCGYPDLARSARILDAMADSKVDLIEAQIPFSDPSADGPAIVEANRAALDAGSTTASCLDMLARLRARTGIPILVMSYLNPLLAFGIGRLVEFMADSGLDGLIVPDCPQDEPEFGLPEAAALHGLAFVPLIAPTTSLERARSLAKSTSSPFVYAVLRLGVTGRTTEIPEALLQRLGQLRSATQRSVAAGFGIGHRSQIESISGHADCAIVGSALLNAYDSAQRAGSDGAKAVAQLIAKLKGRD